MHETALYPPFKVWMAQNFLKFNTEEREIMLVGPKSNSKQLIQNASARDLTFTKKISPHHTHI